MEVMVPNFDFKILCIRHNMKHVTFAGSLQAALRLPLLPE